MTFLSNVIQIKKEIWNKNHFLKLQNQKIIMALVQALSNLTTTQNGDLTHNSSLDKRLDMFYGMLETVSRSRARELTEAAWKVNPQDTLKLIFYILDVRHGKSCNNAALFSLQWLLEHEPSIVEKNLKHIAEFGSYKDYVNLLRILRTNDEEMEQLTQLNRKNKLDKNVTREPLTPSQRHKLSHEDNAFDKHHKTIRSKKSDLITHMTQIIATLFANQLIQDRENMNAKESTERTNISLAAKWTPTKDSALDRETGLNHAIAIALWHLEHKKEKGAKSSMSGQKRKERLQNHLRREFLTPLRNELNIVETKLSNKQIDEINYAHVPSLSMQRNAKIFEKHDNERFTKFVTEHADKLKGGVLKPYQLVAPLIHNHGTKKMSTLNEYVNEAQWNSLVNQIKEQGTLIDALAIVDVSGSMESVIFGSISPLHIAISLGLLIGSVAKPPWKDVVMTFHESPVFVPLEEHKTLKSKVTKVEAMPWGGNTDFDKTFDLILSRAIEHKIKQEDMVKQVFVLSDMQFDCADSSRNGTSFKTAHERLKNKYQVAGYEMPRMIYWNLNGSQTVPVEKDDNGTALVSGFSSNHLRLFLQGALEEMAPLTENDDEMQNLQQNGKRADTWQDPLDVMRKAIDDERYNILTLP